MKSEMKRELAAARVKGNEGNCVWCWIRLKRKATHRVWSREWGMYMNCCVRHAVQVLRSNREVPTAQVPQEFRCEAD
jgi:hypothetical protein